MIRSNSCSTFSRAIPGWRTRSPGRPTGVAGWSIFFRFLRECLRREPDFCLGTLLFARSLAESKKLNEALFVYRYFKERMPVDRSSDMLTLNRLLESFLEKNGWIRFMEDGGDLLDTSGFFEAIAGAGRQSAPAASTSVQETIEDDERASRAAPELPPVEIDIGGASSNELEVLDAIGQSIVQSKGKLPLGKKPSSPMQLQAELIKATVEAAVAGMGSSHAAPRESAHASATRGLAGDPSTAGGRHFECARAPWSAG